MRRGAADKKRGSKAPFFFKKGGLSPALEMHLKLCRRGAVPEA